MKEAIKNNFIYSKKNPYINIVLILSNVILNTVMLFLAVSIKYMTFEHWLFPFAVLSLIQLCMNLITVSKLEKSFFSLTTLFLIFSYITHLGIVVIFGFGIDIELPWNPLLSITEDTFKEACYFTVLCHSFLTFGMCIVLYRRKTYNSPKCEVNSSKEQHRQLYLSRIIGSILILIGILPMLYIDISRVILYVNGNYLDTYKVGVSGFVVTMSRFTEIGAIMLLIGNRENKKRAYLILLIIVMYQAMIIFTGNRGRPIMYLITIFFVYSKFIKKIGLKQFISTSIIGYILGYLLTFIGQLRMLSINDIGTYVELFKKGFTEFSIFKLLAEFGTTIITLGHSLVLFPTVSPFQLGTNYLASLLTVFPNIGGILDPLIDKTIYVYNMPSYARQFLGGSYLGELYYSFGKYSFIFAILIGMLVAFISNKIKKHITQHHYVALAIYLVLFPDLLWWIRGYFVDMVREFVWISVAILILYNYFSRKINKRDFGGEKQSV
ncbi:O-antigen polysaccharide polymerase Wzy [Bacillus sp. FJAT-53711]|uniref:O-antigen polysaccharide polymerase Wzy n=1 Tax=Bacillus yunxiaonensis TaxID=3127665 RepID=A0ABU8FVA3_9BACI